MTEKMTKRLSAKSFRITEERQAIFKDHLKSNDYCFGTIEKYTRDIRKCADWLGDDVVTQEKLVDYKNYLISENYRPATINSMLAAVNVYCQFEGILVKLDFLRIQKRLFRDEGKELTKEEYLQMIETAKEMKKYRLAMIIETIGMTGIRVSELQYFTIEGVKKQKIQIMLKGKVREILLPGKLCKKLLKYAKREKIFSGRIFITRTGHAVSRKQIWSEMKALAKEAGIDPNKVFPHNLRHLFARVYYQITRDVAKLADLLGHSGIETTRIYLMGSGREHRKDLEKLGKILRC